MSREVTAVSRSTRRNRASEFERNQAVVQRNIRLIAGFGAANLSRRRLRATA
jgi:hypothetical protein